MQEIAWEYEYSVVCGASRSFVWAYWTDVSNWERLEGGAVDWIRLDGQFEVGAHGETKAAGQDPRSWSISKVEHEKSATIEMPVDGAVFTNQITLDSLSQNRTRITQRLAVEGVTTQDVLRGMQEFEATAPQGLSKLSATIEDSFTEVSG